MKRIYRYAWGLIALVATITSCDLNVVNPTDVSSETFWKSDADVWGALNTIYSEVIPSTGIYSDAFSDDVRCPYPWESAGSTFQQNGLSSSYDMGYDFTSIRKINKLLKEIDNVPMDAELKKRVIAEARALRAYRYSVLTLSFGKVPIITDVLEYTNRDIKRDEIAKVRAFILSELEAAIKDLPESYPGGYFKETSRLTKYGAEAFRARIALNFGDFKTAEEASRNVMKGGFALHKIDGIPAGAEKEVAQLKQLVDFDALGLDEEKFIQGVFNYRSIWDKEQVYAGAPEVIIVREYMGGNSNYSDLTRYTSMRPQQMIDGWSSVVPQQPLIDAYWSADGKPFTSPTTDARAKAYNKFEKEYKEEMHKDQKTFITLSNEWIDSERYLSYDYMNEFRNRDPRLYASILFPFKRISDYDAGADFVYEWKAGIHNESTTGYNFLKMVAKSTNTMLWGAYPTSEANYPSFRYAEILLIFAEAHIHNKGYDAEVTQALNQLRDRVGMPHVPNGLSKEAALDLVRAERRIELAAEGVRLNDIKRYGKEYAMKHMNNVTISTPNGTKVLTMKWDDRMLYYPIPQSAMDVNPTLTKDQNPGY